MSACVPKVLNLLIPIILLTIGTYSLLTMPSPAFADAGASYAVEDEYSVGAYRGVRAWLTTGNAELNGGTVSNATLWAIDTNNCSGFAWVEAGWSRRSDWNGELRYKFQYKIPPSCVWSVGSSTLGSPAINSGHDYELRFCNECSTGSRWKLLIDGVSKGTVSTSSVFAEELHIGGEVQPAGVPNMGSEYFQNLKWQTSTGTWTAFNFADYYHCDETPAHYQALHFGAPDVWFAYGPDPNNDHCGA